MRIPGRRLLALAGILSLSLGGDVTRAHAEDLPADVNPRVTEEETSAIALPPAPLGFRSEMRGEVTWTYPEDAAYVARDLQDAYDEAWEKVHADLGGDLEGPITVRIAHNPEEMRTLAPAGHPPPAYASGVAYPAFGLILLTLSAPETWARPDMESVFIHELAHIGLHRAVLGRDIPRWFNEGVAIHIAEEQGFERIKTLWNGSLQDRLIPLDRLDARFPAHPHQVNLAYAESADIVRHLREMDSGERRFRRLLREIRRGASFDDALDEAYYLTRAQLEREWLASVAERRRSIPMLIGGSTVWVLASVLALMAWRRRRWQFRRGIARLGRQERAEVEAIERIETSLQRRLEPRRAPAESIPKDAMRRISAHPPSGESEIPNVKHDGETHTLH